MERDMDVIRAIILKTAEARPGESVAEIEGIDPTIFAAHAKWLDEAGLVTAAFIPKDTMRIPTRAIIHRLTWDGCDFADAIRNDTIWERAKAEVIKPSSSWTFGILIDWLRLQITHQLGM